MKKQFRDFESAREFARELNLKGQKEWYAYCKSGNRPDDIPATPEGTYKKDWKGVGDWLGTGKIANQNRVYRSYKDARDFVQKLNLRSKTDWYDYCKLGNKPDDIPSVPNNNYKNDFKGYGDWLGTGTVAPQDRVFLSFKEAREFVRSLKLKGQKEWYAYCKSGNKPDDIPAYPWVVYKEWKKK